MLIGELARQTEISTDTIRFYEKQALLNKNHFVRRQNGYKEYNARAIERLKLIGCAKKLGFTLKEINVFVGDLENDDISLNRKMAALSDKIAVIEKQIVELKETKCYLRRLQKLLSTTENSRTAAECA